MPHSLLIFIGVGLLQCSFAWRFRDVTEVPSEEWTGRWFPERVESSTVSSVKADGDDNTMGVKSFCDDGKTNLDRDLPNADSGICFHPRDRFVPDETLPPVWEYENIPKAYEAQHMCMNESISYLSPVPTFGPHRQLWPVYGEYKSLPAQRWIHTLEHGGIVALYHPCADLHGISLLKKTVRKCLWRHVITPWTDLDSERPFALVAWGVRLRMSVVSENAIRHFIQTNALHGPEQITRDGQFSDLIARRANYVSDTADTQLCPDPLAHD